MIGMVWYGMTWYSIVRFGMVWWVCIRIEVISSKILKEQDIY